MPCGCNAKKKEQSASAKAVQKVRVTCENCTEDLIGSDGMHYPAHLTPVIVTQQQAAVWSNQGHALRVL